MPARKGAVQHNIVLPEEISHQLVRLADTPDYGGSKSEVVEQALRLLLEGTVTSAVLSGVQQQLSVFQAEVTGAVQQLHAEVKAISQGVQGAVQDLTQAVSKLSGAITALDSRLTSMDQRETRRFQELQEAYDRLKAVVRPAPRPGNRRPWWERYRLF